MDSTGLKLSSILEEDRSLLIADGNEGSHKEDNNPLKEALAAISSLAEDEEFNDDEYK